MITFSTFKSLLSEQAKRKLLEEFQKVYPAKEFGPQEYVGAYAAHIWLDNVYSDEMQVYSIPNSLELGFYMSDLESFLEQVTQEPITSIGLFEELFNVSLLKDIIGNPLPRPTKELLAQYESQQLDEEIKNSYNWGLDIFEKGGKYGVVNCIGEVMVDAKYDDFLFFSQVHFKLGSKIVFVKNGLYGVVELGSQNEVIPAQYNYIGNPGTFTLIKKGEYYGIMDIRTQEWFLPLEYDEIQNFQGLVIMDGIGVFKKRGMYGFFDASGIKTKAIFEDYEIEFESSLVVFYEGARGYIDTNGLFTTNEDEAYM